MSNKFIIDLSKIPEDEKARLAKALNAPRPEDLAKERFEQRKKDLIKLRSKLKTFRKEYIADLKAFHSIVTLKVPVKYYVESIHSTKPWIAWGFDEKPMHEQTTKLEKDLKTVYKKHYTKLKAFCKEHRIKIGPVVRFVIEGYRNIEMALIPK